ncbi:MAG: Phenylacetate-coenzyme A ligase [Alphaproteobacteria bacterium MarineAlpha11_Bin1]|nr:MAG: Phenylacetate-coenzyme A ligase [Alphaproteobacteria bacterium MarineAlpha11_Bin1]|tara:strand:- start:881 stop:2191 length:1311 start_codon:yes stop_codon:yes gene_type:complete
MNTSEETLALGIPESPAAIEEIQRRQKPVAFEKAKRATFWKGKLDHINPKKLDDPEEWSKIPILDKDQLREMTTEQFYTDFCTAPPNQICEYWRSGGSTGKPLFYPKTYEDICYNMVGFARTFHCSGTQPGNVAHISFPLGIHPAGHMWARSARIIGVGTIWGGAGASLPSAMQLELISSLKPTIWMGMSSYGLHLANLAAAKGIDLKGGSISRIMCTAEPVSAAKRAKLERDWGAEVYDCFGMTECSMMGAESEKRDGFHIWTDLAHIEVLDEQTMKPVAEGKPGVLVMTPLFSNNGAAFLRWNSGDIVSWKRHGETSSEFAVFPVIEHAHRTAGFFKIRGVNINHQEYEDFIFDIPDVNDFKAELITENNGADKFVLSIEINPESNATTVAQNVIHETKRIFEVTPDINVLDLGTLATEFESSVKAPRFSDRRK